MSEPAQTCENRNYFLEIPFITIGNLKQKYTLTLFIAFKIAYSCCFSFEVKYKIF